MNDNAKKCCLPNKLLTKADSKVWCLKMWLRLEKICRFSFISKIYINTKFNVYSFKWNKVFSLNPDFENVQSSDYRMLPYPSDWR